MPAAKDYLVPFSRCPASNRTLISETKYQSLFAAYVTRMDYQRFYKHLFQPIEERIGHVDEASIMAIIGFNSGASIHRRKSIEMEA